MAKVLLINPSYNPSYGGAKASIVNPIHPTLGLATIAAVARERGHDIEILDLSWRDYNWQDVRDHISRFQPDIIGITATTPLMNQLRDISVLAKDISEEILLVGGGPHPSALPMETLKESMLDAVVVGEADFSFADVCDGQKLSEIKGLVYRDGDECISTGLRDPIANLDDLPIPAWDLYNIDDYHRMSRLLARRPPVTMAEFSRGCVFKCDFCASKITMALGYRKKSPRRCAEEVKRMYELGFREFMLADDIFTSDQKWAKAVCEEIAAADVDMVWSCTNGIRVESADESLFSAMAKAQCYRVSFGFESGNDEVLKSFGKGGLASVEQGRKAVKLARSAGLDTNGFFLLGLSPDTEKTMDDTIDYARKIPVDMMKFGLAIAFPGTAMFDQYVQKKLIRSFDWDNYFIYTSKPLFAHPNLTYEQIQAYARKAYRKCITLNPGFIFRRFIRGIKTGEFFWDAYYSFRFFLMPSIGKDIKTSYYAHDRWPVWDFTKNPPTTSAYKKVKKMKVVNLDVAS